MAWILLLPPTIWATLGFSWAGEGSGTIREDVTFELSLLKGWVGVFKVRGKHSRGLNIMWENAELRKFLVLMVCDPQRVDGALPGAMVQNYPPLQPSSDDAWNRLSNHI